MFSSSNNSNLRYINNSQPQQQQQSPQQQQQSPQQLQQQLQQQQQQQQQQQFSMQQPPPISPFFTPFPIQVQLQQDPRTGLFQILPSAAGFYNQDLNSRPATLGSVDQNYMQQQQQAYIQQQQMQQQQQQQFQQQQQQQRPAAEGKDATNRPPLPVNKNDKRLYQKHQTRDRSNENKPNRYRHRSDNQSEHSKDKDEKDDDDFPIGASKLSTLKKSSSEELLDKLTNANYNHQNGRHGTVKTVKLRDKKSKLKRAKSGSSIDFRKHLDFIPFEVCDDSQLGRHRPGGFKFSTKPG